jgi:hypothetical protein
VFESGPSRLPFDWYHPFPHATSFVVSGRGMTGEEVANTSQVRVALRKPLAHTDFTG